ncbi:MAG TPA: hypothetical protein VK735_15250 [Pseudonocardia sp.]|uniref:hypothetical protein n=1 Tax=Pseudonocardia sp. TaxID=60912 RepID=UPI002B9D4DD5|nr:hypothetical protein [Pseudonocardia sp.]HTF48800.1 hypothetical protein [Pseudonocardia sp.]
MTNHRAGRQPQPAPRPAPRKPGTIVRCVAGCCLGVPDPGIGAVLRPSPFELSVRPSHRFGRPAELVQWRQHYNAPHTEVPSREWVPAIWLTTVPVRKAHRTATTAPPCEADPDEPTPAGVIDQNWVDQLLSDHPPTAPRKFGSATVSAAVDELAEALFLITMELERVRDAGPKGAHTAHETAAYRAGVNQAIALVAQTGLLAAGVGTTNRGGVR